jgi:hypothetical protein
MAGGQPAPNDPTQEGMTTMVGPLEVDWARSIGYFGAITTAVAFEVISWPVGVFIASVPFLKMLNRRRARKPVRFMGHLFDGAAKPVGGDSEGTIRLARKPTPARHARRATRKRRARAA